MRLIEYRKTEKNMKSLQKKSLKILTRKKQVFEKASEIMGELCFVTSVTGLTRPTISTYVYSDNISGLSQNLHAG